MMRPDVYDSWNDMLSRCVWRKMRKRKVNRMPWLTRVDARVYADMSSPPHRPEATYAPTTRNVGIQLWSFVNAGSAWSMPMASSAGPATEVSVPNTTSNPLSAMRHRNGVASERNRPMLR